VLPVTASEDGDCLCPDCLRAAIGLIRPEASADASTPAFPKEHPPC
jgi:hypothetical protein